MVGDLARSFGSIQCLMLMKFPGLIWDSSLCGSNSPHMEDDSFAAGVNSLAAAEFAAALGQHLGVVIEPCWLYDHPRLPEALDAGLSPLNLAPALAPALALHRHHPAPVN